MHIVMFYVSKSAIPQDCLSLAMVVKEKLLTKVSVFEIVSVVSIKQNVRQNRLRIYAISSATMAIT